MIRYLLGLGMRLASWTVATMLSMGTFLHKFALVALVYIRSTCICTMLRVNCMPPRTMVCALVNYGNMAPYTTVALHTLSVQQAAGF